MRFKTTIFLLIIFIIMAGIYYFTLEKEEKVEVDPAEKAKEIFNLDADKIQTMTLTKGETTLALEKKDGQWRLAGSDDRELDQMKVDSLAENLATLSATKIIKEEATADDYSQFGLDENATHITFTLTDGKKYEGWVGNSTPIEDGYYFRRAGINTIYKIAGYLGDKFKPDLDSLRERQIFTLTRGEVEEFTVERVDGKNFTIVREEDNWKLVDGPEGIELDQNKVDSFLNNILTAWITTFVDDNPESYNKYGLTKPLLKVTVKGKDKTEMLAYGIATTETTMYAKKIDRPEVFIVTADSKKVFITAEDLKKDSNTEETSEDS
ncbi:hypothetical protein BBF96_05325 [Anoxybacter fermentans]|uniref:DUF4340 domain-containing protein n=1 Tax=Anoxybacter fermentans TaxID=1323375 RepID=A0A3Q9HQ36_9FIRM|nr:DUF4340 domain-containing protein [Anoxybacter fermentans]AZR72860.1 hypothetical protein BBF96_05325 [Anoxybacter fermentans]